MKGGQYDFQAHVDNVFMSIKSRRAPSRGPVGPFLVVESAKCYTLVMSDHLQNLNQAQKEAVTTTEGPLLVLAGAGAGKTRVIAHRILEIVKRGTPPHQILAITFTNKAAKEMRERIEGLLRSSTEITLGISPEPLPFVSTFHSLGLHIAKEQYRELGLKRFPVVYDRADSLRAMKAALKQIGAEEEIDARAVLSAVSRAKGEGYTADEFTSNAKTPRDNTIAAAWRFYERALLEDGAFDFDDLLMRAAKLLRDREDIRARYQRRFAYVHIDEYQDTNRAQAQLASLIVGDRHNICAVGDIDQTIYTWRGADIKNIMSFEKQFPNAKVVLLEENYRSTKTILQAANDVIAKNNFRVDKNLFTKNAGGEQIGLYQAFDENDEAGWVTRKIKELVADGAQPRDFAILYRANFQSRALEEQLLHGDVPYQVLGTKFFERAEVKDTLAFIRAALLGASADIARIANVPRRGIGKTTLLAMLSGAPLPSAAQGKVNEFRALLSRIKIAAETKMPSDLVRYVVKETGMEREYQQDKIDGVERLENLRELAALAARYDALPLGEGVHAFLENAALASDQDELKDEANAVRLMTIHASKGLEFPYVFITGLEEGLFPYAREGESKADQEEERRLMYVAITRARKKVFLSLASMRTVFGSQSFSEPSQFIADIPDDLIEKEGPERLGRTIYLS